MELFECFACFGEQGLCVVGLSARYEPLAVFELGDGEVEGQPKSAKLGFGGGVVAVGAWVVGGEVGAKAVGGRLEEGRA